MLMSSQSESVYFDKQRATFVNQRLFFEIIGDKLLLFRRQDVKPALFAAGHDRRCTCERCCGLCSRPNHGNCPPPCGEGAHATSTCKDKEVESMSGKASPGHVKQNVLL